MILSHMHIMMTVNLTMIGKNCYHSMQEND